MTKDPRSSKLSAQRTRRSAPSRTRTPGQKKSFAIRLYRLFLGIGDKTRAPIANMPGSRWGDTPGIRSGTKACDRLPGVW
jgi:hypothetical protein